MTYETLFYAATLSLKYFLRYYHLHFFLFTRQIQSEFVSSLSKFGIHYKITYAINIALRYIPDIQSEYKIIKHAQEARGVAFEKGEASLWVRMKNRVLIFLATNHSFSRKNRYGFKCNGFKRIWKEG
ncbi:energy-coupling factor transporter transmembrane component T family protein [Bacillus cereus]